MLIDNKGKIFGKVSIIDVLVVIIILVVAFGMWYKLGRSHSAVIGKSDAVVLKFFADEAPDYAVASVKEGDITGDYEKGAVFGKVTAISVDNAKSPAVAASGEYVMSSKPGYKSAYITVEGQGMLNSTGGLTVNNIDYFIGKTITFKAGNAVFIARICEMNKKG